MEACGTSGMKASLNGVPHISILDGWWIEGFNGKMGGPFPAMVMTGMQRQYTVSSKQKSFPYTIHWTNPVSRLTG